MILGIILGAIYLAVGVAFAIYIAREEKGLPGWEWFWIITCWLPGTLIAIIEIIADYFRLKKK